MERNCPTKVQILSSCVFEFGRTWKAHGQPHRVQMMTLIQGSKDYVTTRTGFTLGLDPVTQGSLAVALSLLHLLQPGLKCTVTFAVVVSFGYPGQRNLSLQPIKWGISLSNTYMFTYLFMHEHMSGLSRCIYVLVKSASDSLSHQFSYSRLAQSCSS